MSIIMLVLMGKYILIVVGTLKPLKSRCNKRGYKYVCLSKGRNTQKCFQVHRLIAKYFLNEFSDDLQVNHIDGVKTHNNIENLEMVSASDNMKHAIKMKLLINKKGENHHSAKLTEKDVIEIRKKYIPKIYTQKMLADEYGVSISEIKCIIHRQTWKHI